MVGSSQLRRPQAARAADVFRQTQPQTHTHVLQVAALDGNSGILARTREHHGGHSVPRVAPQKDDVQGSAASGRHVEAGAPHRRENIEGAATPS